MTKRMICLLSVCDCEVEKMAFHDWNRDGKIDIVDELLFQDIIDPDDELLKSIPKRVSKRNVNVVNTINKETDEHSEIDDKHVSFMDLYICAGIGVWGGSFLSILHSELITDEFISFSFFIGWMVSGLLLLKLLKMSSKLIGTPKTTKLILIFFVLFLPWLISDIKHIIEIL